MIDGNNERFKVMETKRERGMVIIKVCLCSEKENGFTVRKNEEWSI
jgi:hypothetical protein